MIWICVYRHWMIWFWLCRLRPVLTAIYLLITKGYPHSPSAKCTKIGKLRATWENMGGTSFKRPIATVAIMTLEEVLTLNTILNVKHAELVWPPTEGQNLSSQDERLKNLLILAMLKNVRLMLGKPRFLYEFIRILKLIFSPVSGIHSARMNQMIPKIKGCIEMKKPTHLLSPERNIELSRRSLHWDQGVQQNFHSPQKQENRLPTGTSFCMDQVNEKLKKRRTDYNPA